MKRLIFALAAMFAVTALYAQKDSAKVVVTSDGSIVGHYVGQTATSYVANPLDWEVEVPKNGHRVEVWTPEEGKGIIGRRDVASLVSAAAHPLCHRREARTARRAPLGGTGLG